MNSLSYNYYYYYYYYRQSGTVARRSGEMTYRFPIGNIHRPNNYMNRAWRGKKKHRSILSKRAQRPVVDQLLKKYIFFTPRLHVLFVSAE